MLVNRYLNKLAEAQREKPSLGTQVTRSVEHLPKEKSAKDLLVDQIYGFYTDPGYGNVTACPSTLEDLSLSNTSIPPSCKQFILDLDASLPVTPIPPSPRGNSFILVAPGFFGSSHVTWYRTKDHQFSGIAAVRFGPVRERKEDIVVYEWGNEIVLNFVMNVSGGIAGVEVGGVWGAGSEIAALEEKEERQVEVVFDKVERGHWEIE